MIDHLGIQCADVSVSATFYDAVLAPLGASGSWTSVSSSGSASTRSRTSGSGPGPGKDSRKRTLLSPLPIGPAFGPFYDAAVGTGAEVLHEPGDHPEYHPGYYGAFVRDPDGNNVEAVCHVPE